MRECVEQFARETRHRDYELEQPDMLVRKMLACQAPLVGEWKTVFPFVSSDLERIQFRSTVPPDARELPLAFYRSTIPNTHAAMRSVIKDGPGAYTDFKAAIEKAVPWVAEDDVPLLFFAHGARKKNLRLLIEGHYAAAADERKLEDLYQFIGSYVPHAYDSAHNVARDVGFMIVNLPLKHVEEIYVASDAPSPAAVVNNDDETINAPTSMVLAPDTPAAIKDEAKHLERLRQNPVMQQYKASAGLPTQFSSEKALKQMLVSMLVPNQSVASHLMGKRQQRVGAVANIPRADWGYLVSVAASAIDTGKLDALPQVQSFYNLLATSIPRDELEQMSRRDLVEHMITAHMPDWEQLWPGEVTSTTKRAVQKYLKKYPELSPEIVKQINK